MDSKYKRLVQLVVYHMQYALRKCLFRCTFDGTFYMCSDVLVCLCAASHSLYMHKHILYFLSAIEIQLRDLLKDYYSIFKSSDQHNHHSHVDE